MLSRLAAVPLFATLLFSGCATSTFNYVPPTETKIQNTKQVSQSFDVIWDRLVRQLSSDFFIINNIDKNSRLINLSFTSQRPSEFVDCGRTARTFKNARGEQNYAYNSADSSSFSGTIGSGNAFNYRRNPKLEGRTNIYVAPEGSGTVVTVNTKYVVAVNVSAFSLDGRPAGSESITFDFSTKQGLTGGQVTCYALGSIERRILSLIDE